MKYYDVKKIANAIIYFIDNNVCSLGATKLMKLCFYADKYHLEEYGKPIFNHTYTKLDKGPVPTWLYSIIRTSISGDNDYDFSEEVNVFNQYVNVAIEESGKYKQHIFIKKMDFDKQFFSKSQLAILDQVISEFKLDTATEISEKSHQTNAWKNVELYQQISYESMIDDPKTSEYVSYLEYEKESFKRSFKLHKLNKVS
ncbi:MAG: hypothetical protein H6Q35_1384 [Proteobacteria bacterium]|nr:hypothetical protein [Pseudomonadota bacterium]